MNVKMLFIRFLVPLLIPLSIGVQASGTADSPDCQKVASAFLAHPSKYTFTELMAVGEQNCWAFFGSSNSNLQRLTNSVGKGDRWAAEYLAGNLRNLDGGNLEDSLIALGKFSEHGMERFLIFASKGHISKHEFNDALTMLPLSLSDDQSAQLSALKTRRKMVMRVHRNDLLEQKILALKAIDEFISEINSTR